MIKQATVAIVVVVAPIFVNEAQRWVTEQLTATVLEALGLAHEADRVPR